MATKTFSSRADEKRLAYADSLTRKHFNMSYGQYCGSILLDAICEGMSLPQPSGEESSAKTTAIARMKAISQRKHNARIGKMSDQEIKDLIASRYE